MLHCVSLSLSTMSNKPSNTSAIAIKQNKKAPIFQLGPLVLRFSGGRGIRTPGSVTYNSFQDCRIKPLCHSSGHKSIRNFNSITLFMLLFCLFCQIAQSKPKVFISTNQFYNATKGPFLEVHLLIVGKSLIFKRINQKEFTSELHLEMVIQKDDSIVESRKYNLQSPAVQDTITDKPDFFDLQQFWLPNGQYKLKVKLKQNNDYQDSAILQLVKQIHVDFNANQPGFSEIALVEGFVKTEGNVFPAKYGYVMHPYLSKDYPKEVKSLNFYAEIYNLDKLLGDTAKVLVNYFVETFPGMQVVNNLSAYDFKQSTAIIPILGTFNIEPIPIGDYKLRIEIRNKQNNLLLSHNTFFHKVTSIPSSSNEISPLLGNINPNGITNPTKTTQWHFSADSLKECLKCIYPIATKAEKMFIDEDLMLAAPPDLNNFFSNFWLKRNKINPIKEWQNYLHEVKQVQLFFGLKHTPGYKTDRGRVWLQYGKPDNRNIYENESNFLPYEIWQYNSIGNQSNKTFIFYNPDGFANHYQLLHSDLIGEHKNENWMEVLRMSNNSNFTR